MASSDPRSNSWFCSRRSVSSSHSVALAVREPLGVEDPRQAEDRVQLVDRAVGLDAGRVLGDTAPADQRRLAAVAGAGIDARDADRHGSSPCGVDAGASRIPRRRRDVNAPPAARRRPLDDVSGPLDTERAPRADPNRRRPPHAEARARVLRARPHPLAARRRLHHRGRGGPGSRAEDPGPRRGDRGRDPPPPVRGRRRDQGDDHARLLGGGLDPLGRADRPGKGKTFTAGMYACRPPGMVHGPYRVPRGCTTLELRYGKVSS